MNHIYRVVWNVRLGLWQVATEVARGRGKSSSSRSTRTWLALTTASLASGAVYAELPTGGNIVAGTGSISQSGNVMTINQSSQRMATDWQSFSIGASNTVNFVQPSSSSVALNRVVGTDVSVIQGTVHANGQVFLVNPNGVLFSPTAQVNVGSMVASTLQISTADFMAGNYKFENSSGASVQGSAIVNQGNIQAAQGGTVALIAGRISNTGNISANQGNVLMGAGSKVTLDLGGPVKLQVEQGALHALIEQGGVIQADGGVVYLTAKALGDLTSSVINQTGIIEARTLATGEQGQITLLGEGELINVAGTVDASAMQGGVGGRIVATGTHVLIDDNAHLTASGRNGGGQVLVGGSWQNSDTSVYQAAGTVVKASALLEANATDNGNGGTVVAWSDINQTDSATRVYGSLQARGGSQGGHGGRIETSGHWLDVAGVRADSSAAHGPAGQWLLDPYNVTIGSSTSGTAYATPFTPGADSTILASDIAASLEGGTNVVITTGTTGSASIGDITVSSAITKTTGNTDVTLTLRAANSIVIDQAITNSGGTGKLNVLLDADNNNGVRDGGGVIILNNDITTGGGTLAFGTGATITLNSVSTLVGGDVYVAGSGARTLSTGGGAFSVNGEMLIANTAGLTINTQGGNASFAGVLNSANQYDFINKTGSAGTGSWSQARTDAIGATGGGSAIGDTYLVTIGSRLENAVAARSTGYVGAWIGAWRPSTSALNWTWSNGPEGGVNFFNQASFVGGSAGPGGANGTPVNGSYQNFGTGEPNGGSLGTSEHVGQFFGTLGKWNDLVDNTTYSAAGATSQYAVKGFVRETNLAASPLTINAGTGSVTFSRAVGSVKALATLDVTASTVAINGGATTEGTQTYTATGAVTQGGALKANGLALLGTGGDYTLNNTGNDVVTLAADTGVVRFTNSTALTVGTVGSTNGISATGVVAVETQTGDMTVAQNIATSDTTNAAILLNAGKTTAAGTATGGNVVLSGTPTLTTGTGGRATVMSGSISGSTGLTSLIGSASGHFRYNSDEAATHYTTALGTGVYAIYREQPVATLAVDDKSMTYGNALPSFTGSVTGMVNGDAAGALAPTSPTYSSAGELNAGSYSITPTSLTALGYGLSGTAGTLTVGQRTLTVGFTGVNKTYDQTTSATVTTSDNHLSGDVFTINRTATFADKNAGTGKTVSVTGVSLTGTDAANYTVAATGSTTADISPRTLAVTYTGVNKVYDGALTATVTTSDDHISGDSFTIQRTANFADKNAATGKTVNITGVSLTGTDAANYTVATTGSATANITPRTLSITYTGVNKVYDGALTATVTTSDNRVGSDTLTIQRTASFADKNAATGKTVSVTGVSLTGTDAGNYTVATTGSTTADITPRTLSVTYTGVNKVYDGSLTATVTTSDNRVGSDTLTIQRTAGFADKNAATGKTVSVTGVSLTGADAGNYTVATTGNATADITPRTLNVAYTGVNKVYDGSLSATVATSDDRVGSDTLTIERTASFADKNAATGKTVTVSGVSLTGADAGNYTVATTGSTTADIAPRVLHLNYTGVNKVYDGSTTATVNTSDDRINGDSLTIQRSANFLDANVGLGKPIAVSGIALSGTDAGNYSLDSTTGTASADIQQDASLDAALRAPQQLPLPQPTLPPVLTTQVQPPADRTTLDGIGGLKMVPVSSEPAVVSAPSESRSNTNSNSGSATVNTPAAGLDPFGFVRVFVVRGGLNLPTEALNPSDKPAQSGSPR